MEAPKVELEKVEEKFAQLEPRHKQIVESKRIDDRMTAAEWQDFLEPLAKFDRAVDSVDRTGCGAPIWLVILATLLTPFTFGISMVILLVGVIYTKSKADKRITVLDLYNGLRLTALPLVALLAEDVRADEPIHLKMDLGDPLAPGKKIAPPVPVQDPAYTTTSFFSNPWLELEATLANGARLTVRVNDVIRSRTRQKQNPRGKWKTKSKTRVRHHVAVKLVLPAAEKAARPVLKTARATSADAAGYVGVPSTPLKDVVAAIGEAFAKASAPGAVES